MAETRYHLWIPEDEIDSVEKTPTGRSNQYDLVHASSSALPKHLANFPTR